jgi:hypothetical protein
MKTEPWYFLNGLAANVVLDFNLKNESYLEAAKNNMKLIDLELSNVVLNVRGCETALIYHQEINIKD